MGVRYDRIVQGRQRSGREARRHAAARTLARYNRRFVQACGRMRIDGRGWALARPNDKTPLGVNREGSGSGASAVARYACQAFPGGFDSH